METETRTKLDKAVSLAWMVLMVYGIVDISYGLLDSQWLKVVTGAIAVYASYKLVMATQKKEVDTKYDD